MTTRETKLNALQDATEQISEQAYEDLEDQAKLVASNMLLMLGDKAVLSATGFVYATIQLHTAAIAWALSQGYITLTDKAQASEDEMARRKAKTQERTDQAVEAVSGRPATHGAGAYL